MSEISTYRRVVRSGGIADYNLIVEEIEVEGDDDQNIKVTFGGWDDEAYAYFSPAELVEWMETVKEELSL